MDTYETRSAFQLTDQQLLFLIRQRGRELDIANAFAALVRTFETAIAAAPKEDIGGIRIAVQLTKLLSQKYSPGHAEHPFLDFAVASVVKELNHQAKATSAPKLAPAPLAPTPTPKPAPVATAATGGEYKPFQTVTVETSPIQFSNNATPQPSTYYLSKSRRAARSIMADPRPVFTDRLDIVRNCTFEQGITKPDIYNAITMMILKGALVLNSDSTLTKVAENAACLY